jgi:hypothetical protein
VVGNDLRLPRGAGVETPVFVVHRLHALVNDAPWRWYLLWVRGVAVTALTLGGGRRTSPALSASDTAVAPAPAATLVMSAAEAVGDSTTCVSGTMLLTAPWSEAFFPLPNIVGGTLLMIR